MSVLRWGLLSTASIGATVVDACRGAEQLTFGAVASRDREKAARFAMAHGIPRSYGSHEEMLASRDVDAV